MRAQTLLVCLLASCYNSAKPAEGPCALVPAEDGVCAMPTPKRLQIRSTDIADGAVTTDKLSSGILSTVTSALLSDNSVTTSKVVNSAITADKLATDAVESAKIKNLAVTTGKINDLAVTEGKIAAGAVTSTKLASGAVTAAAMASASVDIANVTSRVIGVAQVYVSAAELQNLFTVPKTLVAAPDGDEYLLPLALVLQLKEENGESPAGHLWGGSDYLTLEGTGLTWSNSIYSMEDYSSAFTLGDGALVSLPVQQGGAAILLTPGVALKLKTSNNLTGSGTTGWAVTLVYQRLPVWEG